MRILLLSFINPEKKKQSDILKILEQTAAAAGHQVDVRNGDKDMDNIHLIMYEYIAVIVPASPLFSRKVPVKLPEVLAHCGNVSGKKGAALVIKNGFASVRLSGNVMRAMEKEGMMVDYFDVIESRDHAAAVGRKIG